MGICLSYAKPIIKINGKVIRNYEFKKIKTYEDALSLVDINVDNTTPITIYINKKYEKVYAYQPFQIVESIRVGPKLVIIKRLYGKKSTK